MKKSGSPRGEVGSPASSFCVCLLLEAYVKIGLLAKGGKQEPNGKEHNAVHGMVWLATQVVSSG